MGSIQVFSELLQPQRRPQGKPEKTVLGNEKHSSATLHASVGKCKSTHSRFWGQLQIKGSPGKVTPSMCLTVFPHCYLFLHYLQCELSGVGRGCGWAALEMRKELHSNEEVEEEREGRGLGFCVWVQLCGKGLKLGDGITSTSASVGHQLWVTLGKKGDS